MSLKLVQYAYVLRFCSITKSNYKKSVTCLSQERCLCCFVDYFVPVVCSGEQSGLGIKRISGQNRPPSETIGGPVTWCSF